MIKIEAQRKSYNLKDSWNELTGEEFILTVALINRLFNNEFNLYEFRLQLFQVLTGYEHSRKKFDKSEREEIDDNIFMLSNMLRFPVKPHYPDPEPLEVLSPELREKLKIFFPFEISDEEYQSQLDMVRPILKHEIAPNFNLKSNPLNKFKFKSKTYYGPEFSIDENGVFDTDIIAGEYVAALEYYLLYRSTNSSNYLQYITAFLYRTDRKQFDINDCKAVAKTFKKLPDEISAAVVFFFQNLQELIIQMPEINILYQRKSKKRGISIGVSETLYSLSQEGYGSKAEIDQLPLEDYLKLMLKQLVDYVMQLRGMEIKDTEIAKKTGLPLTIIQKIK